MELDARDAWKNRSISAFLCFIGSVQGDFFMGNQYEKALEHRHLLVEMLVPDVEKRKTPREM